MVGYIPQDRQHSAYWPQLPQSTAGLRAPTQGMTRCTGCNETNFRYGVPTLDPEHPRACSTKCAKRVLEAMAKRKLASAEKGV